MGAAATLGVSEAATDCYMDEGGEEDGNDENSDNKSKDVDSSDEAREAEADGDDAIFRECNPEMAAHLDHAFVNLSFTSRQRIMDPAILPAGDTQEFE